MAAEIFADGDFHEGFASVPTTPEMWKQRINALRKRYRDYADLVSRGEASWKHGDPYRIADWLMIFTPIEQAAWADIRALPFTVWPQFPVGKYCVDFAIVHKQIAIECDGSKYHDAQRDAVRDAALMRMGWHVVRIPGRVCWSDECSEIIGRLA